jgi:hypothetical protein
MIPMAMTMTKEDAWEILAKYGQKSKRQIVTIAKARLGRLPNGYLMGTMFNNCRHDIAEAYRLWKKERMNDD